MHQPEMRPLAQDEERAPFPLPALRPEKLESRRCSRAFIRTSAVGTATSTSSMVRCCEYGARASACRAVGYDYLNRLTHISRCSVLRGGHIVIPVVLCLLASLFSSCRLDSAKLTTDEAEATWAVFQDAVEHGDVQTVRRLTGPALSAEQQALSNQALLDYWRRNLTQARDRLVVRLRRSSTVAYVVYDLDESGQDGSNISGRAVMISKIDGKCRVMGITYHSEMSD